jgi:hypothetical protein
MITINLLNFGPVRLLEIEFPTTTYLTLVQFDITPEIAARAGLMTEAKPLGPVIKKEKS